MFDGISIRTGLLLYLATCLAAPAAAPDFVKQVRPILSDKCFACHGPDKEGQKGGVRLDVREKATEAGRKGTPVVPGKPSESRIIQRITAADPEDRMPPPESKLSLSEEEKAILEAWVAAGAEYEGHWAFQRIERPGIPFTRDPIHPIDAFVEARLNEEGFSLNQEADRESLVRRLHFDLTGLPPTLEEVDAFLADASPNAVEKVVDDLLGRESYGERMASEWLDVARYSDTYGYQVDRDRRVWPWRDWVVKAFNENLSYADFIRYQVAGDLLPGAGRDQILATTFNRLHPQKVEGGSVPEEFRIEYVSDRAQTFSTAFLGLTMECCRCHDHKYDPVSQEDYFSLSAFFDNIDEAGLYSFFTPSVPTPTLMLPSDSQARELDGLKRKVMEAEQTLADYLKEKRKTLKGDRKPMESEAGLVGWFDFETDEAGRMTNRVGGGKPINVGGGNKLVDGKSGRAVLLSGDDEVKLDVGNFKRSQPFSVTLWMKTPDVKDRAVVFHRSRAWTDAASRGYQLLIEEGKLSASLIHFWPGNAIRIKTRSPLPTNQWHHVAFTYDGSSRADGLRLFVDGEPAGVEVVRDRLTKQITGGGGDEVSIGARFRDRGFTGGSVDEMRIYERELSSSEVAKIFDPNRETQPSLEGHLAATDADYRRMLADLNDLRERRDALLDAIPEIMVMRELPEPRPTHILHRGSYDSPRALVSASPPGSLHAFPSGQPRNRLGLTEWLLDRGNPLTARVTVNRYWQMLFGRGLVKTSNDFGSQGELPTHPELLDWLAVDFIESGWDLKHLIRQMVLSRTYQQSWLRRDGLEKKDPQNLLLGRSPRYRLPAEMIRDHALAVSGLLVSRVGGEPVKPYEIAVSFKPQQPDKGEGLYRRSLYTYWKRTAPAPVMMALDASKRDVCSVKRETTATPLQAFVFMNDPQFVEAANHLADRMLKLEEGQAEAALIRMFRLVVGRRPGDRERAVLLEMLEEQRLFYQSDPEGAKKMLSTGARPVKPNEDPTLIAALGAVATALLSHDESVMKP